MYINAISFKSGVRISFTTETPYSVDKLVPGWNIVNDLNNGASLSFIGAEVVHIGSQDLDKVPKENRETRRSQGKRSGKGLKTAIVRE